MIPKNETMLWQVNKSLKRRPSLPRTKYIYLTCKLNSFQRSEIHSCSLRRLIFMVYLATRSADVHHSFLKSMVALKYLPLPSSTQKVVSLRKKITRLGQVALLRMNNYDSLQSVETTPAEDRYLSSEVIQRAPLLLSKARYYNIWGNFLLSFNTAVAGSKHSASIRVI